MPGALIETPSKGPVRFLLVGVGPHAKRTFVKHLRELKREQKGELVAAVDIVPKKEHVEEWAVENLKGVELVFVRTFRHRMPEDVQDQLAEVVHRLRVDCVIISTDPESHMPYGLWAISLGLHAIMDKPISTRRDACNSIEQAAGIADDYNELLAAYKELQKQKETFFLINSHRRYHPGYYGAASFVDEIREKTGCPVTSLISTHCDGHWRLPAEIVDQHYHPYRYGYGKLSHSGYHFFDTAYRFFAVGWNPEKRPDEIEIVSAFVQPNGFMATFTNDEHRRMLGAKEYDSSCKYSAEELRVLMEDMGEVDAMLQISFKRGGLTMAVAQLNLLHNGFARRSWIDHGVNPDLYKGCGRVKHEAHEIRSGPFQTVVIDSRQANHEHDRSQPSTAELGSDNHFEVQTWRNNKILDEQEPLKVYTVSDLDRSEHSKRKGLLVENIKRGILSEAVDYVNGDRVLDDLASNLTDHSIPTAMMGAAYVSHVRRNAGLDPITHIDIAWSSESEKGVPSATIRTADLTTQPSYPSAPSYSPSEPTSCPSDLSSSPIVPSTPMTPAEASNIGTLKLPETALECSVQLSEQLAQ